MINKLKIIFGGALLGLTLASHFTEKGKEIRCDVRLLCESSTINSEINKLLEEIPKNALTESLFIKDLENLKNKLKEKKWKNNQEYWEEYKKIKTLFDIYKLYLETPLTSETNEKIVSIIKEVKDKDLNIEEVKEIKKQIKELIKYEKEKLKDSLFGKTLRDFIEKNIEISLNNKYDFKDKFRGKNFETEEISEFLEIFTIEYANQKNYSIHENNQKNEEIIKQNSLNISKENLNKILENTIKRTKNELNFTVTFYISDSKKDNISINLSKNLFKNTNLENSNKEGIIYSENNDIRKLQENGHAIQHINKSEFKDGKVVFSVQRQRVNPFQESPKGQIQKIFETQTEVKNAVKTGWLVDANNNKFFTLAEDIKNHETKKYATLDTIKFLERVGEEYHQKTGGKIIINSILRTGEENNKLSNSSESSSHKSGFAADLSIIFHDKNGKTNMNEREKNILINLLKEEDQKNNIILILENNPPHAHISVTDIDHAIRLKYESYDKINENFDKINVSENLDNLDITTKYILQDIFYKAQIDYMSFSRDERLKIQENLKIILKYILYIESGGGKYNSRNPVSTATGPYQVLEGYVKNINGFTRNSTYVSEKIEEPKFTTYEKWIRNYSKYANNSKMPNSKYSGNPSWIAKSIDSVGPNKININSYISSEDLTQVQNTNLFLVGTFLGDSKTNAEILLQAIIFGDKEAMQKIYDEIHHTNPDEITKERMKKGMKIYGGKLKAVRNINS